MILKELTDMTTNMAEEVFEMSYNIKPELACWIDRTCFIIEKTIETNIIIAVWPQNIRQIPKLILLLGKMYVIVVLLSKITPN